MELRDILGPIDADVKRVEARLRESARAEFGPLSLVIESLIDSGGKRIRPALVLLAGRMYRQNDEYLMRLAVSVELLHLATLIHDDLLDMANTRRGAATINSKWDSKATVLAGDYVLAKAAKIAAEVDNVKVLGIFAETIMVICEGEIRQDLTSQATPNRDEYYQRIYAKTASLFEGCTQAAAVLGNAPAPHVHALREYGRKLGMAFQIVDDVLDFAGVQRDVGKPLGNDLRQGVLTLPAILYYQAHPGHKVLESVIAKNGHGPEALEATIQDILHSPELAAAEDAARDWAQQAQQELQVLPRNAYRKALHQLAEFVIERKK